MALCGAYSRPAYLVPSTPSRASSWSTTWWRVRATHLLRGLQMATRARLRAKSSAVMEPSPSAGTHTQCQQESGVSTWAVGGAIRHPAKSSRTAVTPRLRLQVCTCTAENSAVADRCCRPGSRNPTHDRAAWRSCPSTTSFLLCLLHAPVLVLPPRELVLSAPAPARQCRVSSKLQPTLHPSPRSNWLNASLKPCSRDDTNSLNAE